MHEQSIIDSILEKLDTQNCEVKSVSLVADEKTLCERLSMDVERDVRSEDVIERSIARIPMYQTLDTIIIDTNAKDVAVIANEIKQL
jgi:shikimate kinase